MRKEVLLRVGEIRQGGRKWSMPRKTYTVVGVVVGLHCVVVGSLFLMHGCGTTAVDKPRERAVVMPPAEPRLTPTLECVELKPAVRPEVVPPASPARAAVAGQDKYTVQKGDYLSKIAGRYGVTTREIMELNGLKSADKIREGQVLVLPAGASKQPGQPVKKPVQPPVASAAGMEVYTVQNGDCLSKVAVRCGTTVQALRNQNKLTGDRIYVGQQLLVPQGGAPQAPAVSTTAAAEKPAPSVEPKAPPIQPPAGFITYDVQYGETLDEVAAKFAVSADRLVSVNKLKSRTLKAGMTLRIPQGE